jgi:hypothetical protein
LLFSQSTKKSIVSSRNCRRLFIFLVRHFNTSEANSAILSMLSHELGTEILTLINDCMKIAHIQRK